MKYKLILYILGDNLKSKRSIEIIENICQTELEGKYTLEVVDIQKNPQLAEDEKIVAVPTLIKQLPDPLRRIVGDLSNKEKVLLGLDIKPST